MVVGWAKDAEGSGNGLDEGAGEPRVAEGDSDGTSGADVDVVAIAIVEDGDGATLAEGELDLKEASTAVRGLGGGEIGIAFVDGVAFGSIGAQKCVEEPVNDVEGFERFVIFGGGDGGFGGNGHGGSLGWWLEDRQYRRASQGWKRQIREIERGR